MDHVFVKDHGEALAVKPAVVGGLITHARVAAAAAEFMYTTSELCRSIRARVRFN